MTTRSRESGARDTLSLPIHPLGVTPRGELLSGIKPPLTRILARNKAFFSQIVITGIDHRTPASAAPPDEGGGAGEARRVSGVGYGKEILADVK